MSAQSQTLDVFRERLPEDADTLDQLFSELTVRSGTSVPNSVRESIANLYDRWSVLDTSIRAPDYSSGSAMLNYIEYFLRMIENWIRNNGSKFNISLSVLYGGTGNLDADLKDLISYGQSSTNASLFQAATTLDKVTSSWLTLFPNAGAQPQDNSRTKLRQIFTKWGKEAKDTLIMIKPSVKLFAATGLSRPMNDDLWSNLGFTNLVTGYPTIGSSGAAAVEQVIQLSNSTIVRGFYYNTAVGTAFSPCATATPVFSVPTGGMQIQCMLHKFNGPATLAAQAYTLAQWPNNNTITATDGTTTLTYTGINLESVFMVNLPYTANGTWTFGIQCVGTVASTAAYTVSSVEFRVCRITLQSLRPLVLSTTGGVIDTVPTVGDVIGTLTGDIYEDFIDLDLQDGWTLLRRYTAFQQSRGYQTIINALQQCAVNLGIFSSLSQTVNTLDNRVLDIAWWFNYTGESTLTVQQKKTLYRFFYQCLEDFLIMASSDGAFQNSLLNV